MKKAGKTVISLMVSLGVAASGMFAYGAAPVLALADENEAAITYQSDVLIKNANQDGAQQVLYGGRDWYVIAYDGKDGDGSVITYDNPAEEKEQLHPDGAITLFQNGTPESSVFHDDADNVAFYYAYGFVNDSRDPDVPSKLRETIENVYLTGDKACLNAGEQGAILPRTLTGGCSIWYHDTHPDYDPNHIANKGLDDALVWPLSVAEANSTNGAIRGASGEFWLRTPGGYPYATMYYKYASYVNWKGDTVQNGDYVTNSKGVRPALYLDKNKVLLTSASVGGKVSGKTGPNALKKVTNNTEDEWILTIQDDAHAAFRIDPSKTERPDCQSVKISYSGAATGEKEYISAVVMDAENNIKQYGRVKSCTEAEDASGDVTISLKGKLEDGDSLCIFNEQYNGDEKTDFASGLYEVWMPEGGHQLTDVPASDPKCTDPGNTEYWTCSVCGGFFGDENAKQPIKKDSWLIPAKGHTVIHVGTKATPDAEGSIWERCSECGQNLTEPETIFCPKTVAFSPKTSIYDGKAKTPAVLVSDTEGKLIKGENYDVAYGNNVKAGTATVTVTFKGDFYEGTLEKPFSILKAANTLSVSGKKITVKAKALPGKLPAKKVIRFKNKGQGPKVFKLVSAVKGTKSFKKFFAINPKTGILTMKKGLGAGTYKVMIKVKATGNDNYKASGVKTVTCRIRIK